MALSAEEEETIESIKKWWRESGQKLAAVAAVVLAGWFGWQLWQGAQQSAAAEASAVFDELSAITAVQPGESLSEDQRVDAAELVARLKDEHAGTPYALYGALIGARVAVEADDLQEAEQQLQWVLDNRGDGLFAGTEPSLVLLTQLRLGRVLLARGEPGRALSLISGVEPGVYAPQFNELRGDIHVAQGQNDQAIEAYRSAREGFGGGGNRILEMKLNDLGADS